MSDERLAALAPIGARKLIETNRQNLDEIQGVDLREELPELPELPEQPWPCYSWRNDLPEPEIDGIPASGLNQMKRVDDLDAKLDAQELDAQEGHPDA